MFIVAGLEPTRNPVSVKDIVRVLPTAPDPMAATPRSMFGEVSAGFVRPLSVEMEKSPIVPLQETLPELTVPAQGR